MYAELFNTYDKEKKGVINAECMYDIGNLLGKEAEISKKNPIQSDKL
jgi:hypothetical protein